MWLNLCSPLLQILVSIAGKEKCRAGKARSLVLLGACLETFPGRGTSLLVIILCGVFVVDT